MFFRPYCRGTKKDEKTYFHFPDGLYSTSFVIKNYPNIPQKVTLLNTNGPLEAVVERIPEMGIANTGIGGFYLHIKGIPVDDLCAEPIVIEIQW